MFKLKSKMLVMALAVITIFGACKKNSVVKETALAVNISNPQSLQNVVLKTGTITFKEVNSGVVTTVDIKDTNKLNIILAQGAYNVTLVGEITYTLNDVAYTSSVRAVKEAVIVTGDVSDLGLNMIFYKEDPSLVIKEVFFTGTVTPQGKAYNGDKYFVIHNNSNKIQYADSLIIAESEFLTTTKRIYTPDVMSTDFTSGTVVMIPGTGKSYPIQPGKSIVVANNAINHLEYNSNSVDLSKADFELKLLASINVDNPQVTDLENVTGAALTMHNRGYKAYIIAKMKGSTADFLKNQVYDYSYANSATTTRKVTSYKIPNSWILDAVNLSVGTEFAWIVTSPQLDMGWSFCGKIDGDATRYGKSVIRKVASTTTDGRVVLQDTNNSTEDFTPESKPSLFK